MESYREKHTEDTEREQKILSAFFRPAGGDAALLCFFLDFHKPDSRNLVKREHTGETPG
jgi:hypothetical protein